MRLDDLIFLGAMGPPGGGRSNITNRCLRHFNVICYTDLDENTIKTIFLTIINAFLVVNTFLFSINCIMIVFNSLLFYSIRGSLSLSRK